MLAFFLLVLLEKKKIMLLTYDKKWKRNNFVSFKGQIFISSINNYKVSYQIVTSCLGIARSYLACVADELNIPRFSLSAMKASSYYVATVGVNNKPVQNTQ